MAKENYNNPLIFGKDTTENIVSCEIVDNDVVLFLEDKDGVTTKTFPNKYWLVAKFNHQNKFERLEGDLPYKHIKLYDDRETYLKKRNANSKKVYSIYDEKEAASVYHGFTYFKGLKVEDVSILSFDIETTGLIHNDKAKVLLIANTLRVNGVVTRKQFAYDDYENDAEMFRAWNKWVQEVNPSVLCGHNIYCYDLPYMIFCAKKNGVELEIGRDGSPIKVSSRTAKFRKDASQEYEYNKMYVFGREIVDTFFLAVRYDFGRKYPNYKLKDLVAFEGLEVKGRMHYDASQIFRKYKIPSEWKKIKEYAEHDADDSLALYDLMISPFFYLCQSVPKAFQSILTSASGSQINAFLVRSYLQENHSLPESSAPEPFEGAISFGNTGVHHNVFKVDVASLYPSIMRQYKVYDKDKDPKKHFLNMVEHFTLERLANKKKASDTGDRYYKDLEQAQKIIINSAYGMLGTRGLIFNSPKNAAFVTSTGRQILQTSIKWACGTELVHANKVNKDGKVEMNNETNQPKKAWQLATKELSGKGFVLVNCDTDSISYRKPGVGRITDEEKLQHLEEINKLYPELISWEDDGYYKSILVVKAKNYALYDGKKTKFKGSALKAPYKEKALKEFIDEVINLLLNKKKDQILNLYNKYVDEIVNLKDISRWTFKKTVTKSVLNPERANEQKVLDALEGIHVQEGDKFFFYFNDIGTLTVQEKHNGDHDVDKLFEKLYKTIEIFKTVLDTDLFPNYKLKRNKILLGGQDGEKEN